MYISLLEMLLSVSDMLVPHATRADSWQLYFELLQEPLLHDLIYILPKLFDKMKQTTNINSSFLVFTCSLLVYSLLCYSGMKRY